MQHLVAVWTNRTKVHLRIDRVLTFTRCKRNQVVHMDKPFANLSIGAFKVESANRADWTKNRDARLPGLWISLHAAHLNSDSISFDQLTCSFFRGKEKLTNGPLFDLTGGVKQERGRCTNLCFGLDIQKIIC